MLTGVNVLLGAACSGSLFTGGGGVAIGTSNVGVGSPNRLTVGGTV